MKTKIFLLIVLTMGLQGLFAAPAVKKKNIPEEEDEFKNHTLLLGIGVGYRSMGDVGKNLNVTGQKVTTPPITLSIDWYSPLWSLSFGGFYMYQSTSGSYSDRFCNVSPCTSVSQVGSSSLNGFGVRMAYHINKWLRLRSFDTYIGVMLGSVTAKSTVTATSTTGTIFGQSTGNTSGDVDVFGAHIGSRYFFSKYFAVFIDAGYCSFGSFGSFCVNGGILGGF